MTTMPNARPILMMTMIGAIVLAVCCALVGGGALIDGAKTAIAVSR